MLLAGPQHSAPTDALGGVLSIGRFFAVDRKPHLVQGIEIGRKGENQFDDGGCKVRVAQEVFAVEVEVVDRDADTALLFVAGSEDGPNVALLTGEDSGGSIAFAGGLHDVPGGRSLRYAPADVGSEDLPLRRGVDPRRKVGDSNSVTEQQPHEPRQQQAIEQHPPDLSG